MRPTALLILATAVGASQPSTPRNNASLRASLSPQEPSDPQRRQGWFGRRGSTAEGAWSDLSHTHSGLDGIDHGCEMPCDAEAVAKAKNVIEPEKDRELVFCNLWGFLCSCFSFSFPYNRCLSHTTSVSYFHILVLSMYVVPSKRRKRLP